MRAVGGRCSFGLKGGRDEPAVEEIAAAGTVVVRLAEPGDDDSLESLSAYLSDLLDQLRTRDDVDASRVAIGGSGRMAPAAVALGARLRQRLAGVVAHAWSSRRSPRLAPRLAPNRPDARLGFLLTGGGQRDEALKKLIDAEGYPVLVDDQGDFGSRIAGWVASLKGL